RIFGDGRLRFNGPVNALAYSSDGKRLATASGDGVVRIWDAETGHEVSQFAEHTGHVSALAFHPSGKVVASIDDNSIEIKIWNADDGKPQKSLNRHKEAFISLAFSPDGSLLAGGGGSDKHLWVYDVARGAVKHELSGHNLAIKAIAFSPDGK